MGLLGNMKDVLDEKALVEAATQTLVPAIREALAQVVTQAVQQLVEQLDGMTITIHRKAS